MKSLSTSKTWQRERALLLDREFRAIRDEVRLAGGGITIRLIALATRLHGHPLDNGKRALKATPVTIRRAWDTWRKNGCKTSALLPGYKGNEHTMPPELAAEIQRIASSETGGRDKHGKGWEKTRLRKHLETLWHRGQPLPGLGTWQEWWQATYPHLALPPIPPEFPWSAKTVGRNFGTAAARATGNIGAAAANKHLPSLTLDYSNLRRCELYTLDDVRLDIAAIDDLTGKVCHVTAYIMMEVSSRSIPAFLVKPEDAITAADVDDLVATALQADGYGIGIGYQTHIKFERGTVACSEAAERVLEGGSDGRIKIHRTGMDGGTRWAGAAADRGTGHSAGKAVIESFNRNLHRRLLALPGQRGNTFDNSPANLGIEKRGAKDASKRKAETLTAAAERLAQFRMTALAAGERANLVLPLLLVSQLQQCVAAAIRDHNTTGGHGMQGFHHVTEAATAPGIWQEIQ